jgi:uncharacterized protein (DUF1330 family)
MPKGYVIVHVTVNDTENYSNYAAAGLGVLEEFGGKILVRGGKAEVREGQLRDRNIVIEFASFDKAVEWYESEQYAPALAIRKECADSDFVIVEGAG